jgi:hypothetical protein
MKIWKSWEAGANKKHPPNVYVAKCMVSFFYLQIMLLKSFSLNCYLLLPCSLHSLVFVYCARILKEDQARRIAEKHHSL